MELDPSAALFAGLPEVPLLECFKGYAELLRVMQDAGRNP